MGHGSLTGRAHRANLQVGEFVQEKNVLPRRVRRSTSWPPQPDSGQTMPRVTGLVVLHSGYPEQAMNLPKRPCLITIGLLQVGQISSVGSSAGFSRPPRSLVYLHSGYAEQARKLPKRPNFLTTGLPHSGQASPVSWPTLTFSIFLPALLRSRENCL